MLYRSISTLAKLLLASFFAGMALAALNVTPEQILRELGLTPALLADTLPHALHWAMSLVVLGSLVTVPIWLVMRALRPPRRG